MSNYPNDPNQPGGYGEQQPNDGSSGSPYGGAPKYGEQQPGGQPQYGQQPQYGAQPYGSPQYGAPQPGGPYGAPGPAADHKRAVLIMVLGILSIPCCGLFTGIPAIIMGRQTLQEIDSSGGAIGGRSKVQAGFICGIIGTVLSILGVIARLTILNK